MKKHITNLCLLAVVLIITPLSIALGQNGGCSVQAKISTPHQYGVNSWVEGYTWFSYPEAIYISIGIETYLNKNGSMVSGSGRGTTTSLSGPSGEAKYVAVYGSSCGVYDYNGANIGEQFQTVASAWNYWVMRGGGGTVAGHTHYSSVVTIS